MPSGKKQWRFEGFIDDEIAHTLMLAMGRSKKVIVEVFSPVDNQIEAEAITMVSNNTEFVVAYIAEHPQFKTADLRDAARAAGYNPAAVAQAVHHMQTKKKTLKRIGVGEYAVVEPKAKKKKLVKAKSKKAPPVAKGADYKPREGTVAAKIIQLLKSKTEPMAGSAIKEAVAGDGSENGVSVALSNLIARNIVERPKPAHYQLAQQQH